MRANLILSTTAWVGLFVASCHSSITPSEAIVGGCGVVTETTTDRPFVVWGELDELGTMVIIVPPGCANEACSGVRGHEFDSLSIPPVDSADFPRVFDTIYAAVVEGSRPDVRVRSGRGNLRLEDLRLDAELVFDGEEGPPRRFRASQTEMAMFCPRALPPG